MMRPAATLASLLTMLLSGCTTPARHTAQPDTADRAQGQATPSSLEANALPGARAAADRLLNFLSILDSTGTLQPAPLGRAFGVTLGPDATNGTGWTFYHSPDLGQGWTYWVQQSNARPSMKNGFRFWFEHPDRTADATPVCALTLDRLRNTLTAHGWRERPVPSEIGSILAVEFSKADVVLTLTPRDGVEVRGIACVLSIQTTDGH
ncbi:hypothetical protein KCV01_g10989, partial [Aureobasidium melanogenum]